MLGSTPGRVDARSGFDNTRKCRFGRRRTTRIEKIQWGLSDCLLSACQNKPKCQSTISFLPPAGRCLAFACFPKALSVCQCQYSSTKYCLRSGSGRAKPNSGDITRMPRLRLLRSAGRAPGGLPSLPSLRFLQLNFHQIHVHVFDLLYISRFGFPMHLETSPETIKGT